jgi:hypothetical protein
MLAGYPRRYAASLMCRMKCLSQKLSCGAFILTMLLSFAAVANAQGTQVTRQDIFDPFDQWFGSLSSERERERLDNFSNELLHEPDWVGYIVVYAGKESCRGEARRRADRLRKYVVGYRKISRDRVITKDGGYFEQPMVVLQPIPRSQSSTSLFTYYPKTAEHIVRKCGERKSNRGRRPRS